MDPDPHSNKYSALFILNVHQYMPYILCNMYMSISNILSWYELKQYVF